MEITHTLTKEIKLAVWGPGKWVQEGEIYEWEYQEISCKIMRAGVFEGNLPVFALGHLNGYIKVPPDHPWYGKDYCDIDAYVHGGVTYAETENDGSWIGFDAAHSHDVVPGVEKMREKLNIEVAQSMRRPLKEALLSPIFKRKYRNFSFMKKECESLVDQMLAVKEN